MSRITHDDLWDYYIIKKKSLCLCCQKVTMYRDDHTTWRRGHVIPHHLQGPDIYENIRPICLKCNNADKSYSDSYAYMVEIGTMTASDRKKKLAHIRKVHLALIENPYQNICGAIQQNGKACSNKCKPHMSSCGKHGITIRTYMVQIALKLIQIHKFVLQNSELLDADELKEIQQMEKESVDLYKSY